MKQQALLWSLEAAASFAAFTSFIILHVQDFDSVFWLDTNESIQGIGGVLSQEGKPLAFFSEKLSGARLNYCTYDLKFYAIVQAIKH